MKKIVVLLIATFFLTGCFSYRDVNRVIFVTSLGIDIDENNKPVLYAEAFRSIRTTEAASGRESRLILTASGDTIFEAIRNINTTSAFKLNYTQNKAIIFSERAAEYGLDNFLDVLFRDQEFLTRQFIYISKINLEDLMKVELQDEMFLGIYLFDLSENKPNQAKNPYMRIDRFYIERRLGSKINGINTISRHDNPFIDRIILSGLSILKEDKLIHYLNDDETFFYSIAKDNLRSGYITVANPDHQDKLITLEVLKCNTKTTLDYNSEGMIDLKKEISIRTTIAEVQENFELSSIEKRDLLEEYANQKVEKDIMSLYEKYKEKDLDILDLERSIDIKYPNANINPDNLFDSINFSIHVDVFVEGSTDVVTFY